MAWPTEIGGVRYTDNETAGRDCSGTRKRDDQSLKLESSPGLSSAVTDQAYGRWPRISKTADWDDDGYGSKAEKTWDWGRSEAERGAWIGFISKGAYERQNRWWTRYSVEKRRLLEQGWNEKVNLAARREWLNENPTWWEEKRRAAEIDASPQVAGEMTDMGLDNRSIVAGHLAKTVEGSEVVEIRATFSYADNVKSWNTRN